jgi:hypothetical protein
MEQVAKLLEQLATKLGTTVEYLWSVLIKQAFIEGVINTIVASLCLLTIIGIAIWVKYCLGKDGEDREIRYYYMFDDGSLAVITQIVFTIVATIVLFICIGSAITCFYNPEYWALNEILSKLGK